MTTGPLSQCGTCQRLRSPFSLEATGQDGPWCEAFPTGIPEPVYDNTLDHRQPVDGDHGLQWLARPGATYPDTTIPGETLVAHLPGKHDQREHGRGGGGGSTPGSGTALEGEDALEATSYRLEGRGPETSQGVSRAQMDATLASYAGFGHGSTNHDLRQAQGGPIPPRSRVMTRRIDAAMASSELSAPVTVTRQVQSGPIAFGGAWHRNMTGVEYVDHGFVSASANPNLRGVPSYGSKKAVTLRITAPAGTRAVTLARPGDRQEMEILLDRGMRYRITGDRTVDGIRTLDVEVIGR